jgi:hypothetical protein
MQRWQEVSAEVMKELQNGQITPLFANVPSTYKLEAH